MSEELFKISGGYVYDPANGIDGQVKDLWIQAGKIVEAPSDPQVRPSRTLNAAGLVIMPGGGGVVRDLFRPALPAMESLRPEVREQLEGLSAGSPIVVNPRGFRAYVRNDTFFRSIPGVLERVPGTMFLCRIHSNWLRKT